MREEGGEQTTEEGAALVDGFGSVKPHLAWPAWLGSRRSGILLLLLLLLATRLRALIEAEPIVDDGRRKSSDVWCCCWRV